MRSRSSSITRSPMRISAPANRTGGRSMPSAPANWRSKCGAICCTRTRFGVRAPVSWICTQADDASGVAMSDWCPPTELPDLRNASIIAVDTETFDREQVTRWLRDLIASEVRIITKNGLYDWGWLHADLGIAMPPAERLKEIDALATMVDENRRKYSLDALCAWRGFPGKDETTLLEGCAALGLIPKKNRKTFKPQSVLWQLPARFVGP